MTSHLFAETTHVVAVPYGFACVVIPPRSYTFQVSSKYVQEVLSQEGSTLAFLITLAIGFYSNLYTSEQGMGRWVMGHGSNGSRKSDGSHGSHGSWVTRC